MAMIALFSYKIAEEFLLNKNYSTGCFLGLISHVSLLGKSLQNTADHTNYLQNTFVLPYFSWLWLECHAEKTHDRCGKKIRGYRDRHYCVATDGQVKRWNHSPKARSIQLSKWVPKQSLARSKSFISYYAYQVVKNFKIPTILKRWTSSSFYGKYVRFILSSEHGRDENLPKLSAGRHCQPCRWPEGMNLPAAVWL